MASNSILNNLEYKDMISTIKLEMGADFKKEKVFLVVEGKDDIKFFKYFCQNNVNLCESYSGKKGIEEILLYFKNNKNIIGIRDRDYENRILDNRIFFYDYCNIEMMIINDDDVFEKICCEYYDGEKEYYNLRAEILNNLILVSQLRKINENEKKMWNFKRINYSQILNEDCSMNKSKLMETLLEITAFSSEEELLKEIGILKKCTYKDFLNITNGHDFIRIFCECCKKSTGKNINENVMYEVLRCGFCKNNFKKTNLFKNINIYQRNNSFAII